MVKKCFFCEIIFNTDDKRRKFCSENCFRRSNIPWNKGKKFEKYTHPMFGKHHSKNSKKKMRDSRLKWIKENNRPLNWKGGKTVGSKKSGGYVYIWSPKHPNNHGGYVSEHRLVVENSIGRFLEPKEVVHHINNNPKDNRIENLMLFKNNGEHLKYHKIERQKARSKNVFN